jgi:hypothetical protein
VTRRGGGDAFAVSVTSDATTRRALRRRAPRGTRPR